MAKIKILIIIAALLPSFLAFPQAGLINLPEWFFNKSNYNSGNLAIGISDTGMDEAEAFKQAKERAILNFCLLNQSKFSSLTTLGIGNQQNNASQTNTSEYVLYASILRGKLLHFEKLTMLDSFYTNNKEAIVLLKLESTSEDSLETTFEISRRAGFQKDNHDLPLFVDELTVKLISSDSTNYRSDVYKENGRIIKPKKKVETNFFNYKPNDRILYQYKNYDSKNNFSLPCALNSGLWNAYIFNLVDQICIFNSLENDLLHKLSTTNLGVLDKLVNNETLLQFVYSLKNLQTIEITAKIDKICVSGNELQLAIKNSALDENTISDGVLKLNRKEKKELKRINEDGWQYIGNQDVETSWIGSKMPSNENTIVATRNIKSSDLNSAILEAIHLAKLELSSQLESKITSLNNIKLDNNEQNQMQTAKLLNIMKTKRISPFYLFYRKIGPSAYQVKVVLFYKMD